MASHDTPNAAVDARAVNLTIHTQLSSNPVINVPGIRVNETIRDVKDRIRMAIPSHPSPSNMKLIYRGHRRNEMDTLEAVFTPEAVRRETNYTMHLVISDTAAAQSIPSSRPVSRNTATGGPIPQLVNGGPVPHQQFHVPIAQGHPATIPTLQPHGPNQMQPPWGQFPQFQQPPNLFGHPQPVNPMAFQQGQLQQQPPLHQNPNVNAMVQNALQSSMDLSQRLQQQASMLREQLDQAPQSSEWEQPRQLMDQVTGQLQVLQQTLNENPAGSNPEFQAELDRLRERAQNVQRELDTTPGADNQDAQSLQQQHLSGVAQNRNTHGSPMPNGTNPNQTFTRQGTGPNGTSWSFTSTTSFPVMPQQGDPQNIEPHPNVLGFPPHLLAPRPPPTSNADPSWLSASHSISYLDSVQTQLDDAAQGYQRLQNLMREDNAGTAQAELLASRNRIRDIVQSRNAMQRTINQVLSDGVPQGHTEPTEEQVARLQSMSERFASSVRDFEQTDRTQREHVRSRTPTNNQPPPSTRPTVAYLLNSPQGPRGIVYSPAGAFRTAPAPNAQRVPMAQPSNIRPAPVVPQAPQPAAATRQPQPTPTTNAPPTNTDPNRPASISDIQDLRNQLERELAGMRTNNQAIREILRTARGGAPQPAVQALEPPLFPGNAAPQQAHPPEAEGDRPPLPAGYHEHVVAINLTPFFQALWLFIRMYGIMWILMGGTGDSWTSWQFLTLIATSILYWAYQAGYGRQQVEDAVRWWEGLTGGGQAAQAGNGAGGPGANRQAGAQPGNASAAGGQPNGNAQQPANAAQPGGPPANPGANPAQQQPRNALREAIRPFEQTVALLFASLWPGVGERHVAERERLRREEAEREVQRRRQEEEARTGSAEQAPARDANHAGTDGGQVSEGTKTSEVGRSGEASGANGSSEDRASSSAVAVQDTQQSSLTERRPGGAENAAGSDW